MNRAVVALLVSGSLLGCFPHDKRASTYAKIGEGTAIIAGIAISAYANTSADCDQMAKPGIDDSGCKGTAKWLSTAGVTLIVSGLLGFVATVSTEEQDAKPKPVEIKAAPPKAEAKAPEPTPPQDQKPATDPNAAGSADPNAAGSAAPSPSAPPQE